MLAQRIASALVLIPIVLLAIWLGGPWFAGLIALFALRATWEFYELARKSGHRPTDVAGLALVIANFTYEPVAAMSVLVRDAKNVVSVFSIEQDKEIPFTIEKDGAVKFTVPLKLNDLILLKRSGTSKK